MKLRFIPVSLLVVSAFSISAFSQKLTPREILGQSAADLVIVGKIDGYGHTYNRPGSDNLDGTFAFFRVLRVLKGKFTERNIEVRLPDHIGFSDYTNFIIFITFDMEKVAGNRKIGNCQTSPCFYSKWEWLLSNTKTNLRKVNKLVK
jgi:hypothetical protein